MDPVIEEICRANELPTRQDVFRRWQRHLREVVQPQLKELAAIKAQPARENTHVDIVPKVRRKRVRSRNASLRLLRRQRRAAEAIEAARVEGDTGEAIGATEEIKEEVNEAHDRLSSR